MRELGLWAIVSTCPRSEEHTHLPSPMRSPQYSMGALSFSPSPDAAKFRLCKTRDELCTSLHRRTNHDDAIKRNAPQHRPHCVHGSAVGRVLLALAQPVSGGQRCRLGHAHLRQTQGCHMSAPALTLVKTLVRRARAVRVQAREVGERAPQAPGAESTQAATRPRPGLGQAARTSSSARLRCTAE